MSFLYPAFLAGALAVAIPIVLHLLRRRTSLVVDFPAVQLLQRSPAEREQRRRLRELILLALRAAALILLALAFARPYFAAASGGLPAPVTVVALDTSLSMATPAQFAAAQEAARAAVRDAPSTHLVGLVSFDDSPTLVVPPTTDRGGVLAAIGDVRPSARGTRYRSALARAADAILGAGVIVVVTDLQQVGWDAPDEGAVPEDIEIRVVAIPAPVANVAVTSARRDADAIVASVHNFGPVPARVPIRLEIDGRVLAREEVEIAPHAAIDARLRARLPARGGAAVVVDDPGGYTGDNARFVVLEPPPAVPLYVLTARPPASSRAGLYVERALALAGGGGVFDVRVVDGRAFGALDGEPLAGAGAVVLLGTTTLDRTGRERIARFVGDGGRALIALGPEIDLATIEETVGVPLDIAGEPVEPPGGVATLIAADVRHPLFRPFLDPAGALGDVRVWRYRRLGPKEGRAVLALFSSGDPALVEYRVGKGQLLVFASDLDNEWNRFPLTPSFVPWAVEAARYLAAGRDERQAFTLPHVPREIPQAPGLYPLGERTVAVNPDVRESNPAVLPAESFAEAMPRSPASTAERAQAAAREQEERQRLWQLGLLVMLVALGAEGMIGRKAA